MSLASGVSSLAGAVRDKLNTIMPRLLPPGGTTGQVLSKTSATNYDSGWTTPSGGGSSDPLDLTATDPAIPAAGAVRLFRRDIAGRQMPAFVGPTGLDTAIQPFLARNKIGLFIPPGNATTSQVLGMNVSGTGTVTRADIAVTNIHTAIRRLEYAATAASVTAVAGLRSAAAQYWLGSPGDQVGGFTFVTRFGPSRGSASNTTRRFFAGMTSRTNAPTDLNPTAGTTWANMIGVGCDATDINFQVMHRTGTGAVTKVDTGIKKAYLDNSEMFELALFTAPTGTPAVGVQFTRLSDGLVFNHVITTNLPSTTQLLTWQIWNSVGGTSSTIGMAVASVYIESDL